MDDNHEQDTAPEEIPVLQEIVEIHINTEGKRVTVPLDLEQLATRITDELAGQLQKELTQQLESCLDQALDAAMVKIRREVQRLLLTQLGNPEP
ncbi:MAG: hypothetical protein KKE76_15530 [Gammaproteobacteria bacterium]|nr:hypothetical protein [Gammaproteobacteria bacterium]